jgi:transposase
MFEMVPRFVYWGERVMSRKRKQHSGEWKARVALAAVKGDRTTSELAAKFEVHPTQVTQWKRQLLEGAAEIFSRDRPAESEEQEALVTELYEQIGRLQMELGWVKKKAAQFS